MTLSPQDILKLRVPVIFFAFMLIMVALLGWLTETRKLDAEQRLQSQKALLIQAEQRYRTSGEEKETINKYLPEYQRLIELGFIGQENRLDFALMYETGIPVLDAVKTCQDIVSNKVVADALERAYQQINAGDTMSESFRNAGLFPPLVVRMIKVGENTGALDKSLSNIGYFYDRDVNESIEKMLKLIEPALTVVLGGILAFIMFSVLGPVYDSFSKLKL